MRGNPATFSKSLFLVLAAFSVVLSPRTIAATELRAQCTTSFGRAMDTSKPAASVTVEPKLLVKTSDRWSLKLYSLIDRPTDPHEDFAIPSIDGSIEFAQALREGWRAGAFAQASAVNILHWDVDGWISRFAAGPWTAWQPTDWLRFEATIGPFVQISQYTHGADGEAFSVFGVGEQIKAVLEFSKWTAEVSLTLVQSRKHLWRNEYASIQQISYAATSHLSVGLTHQLADESVSLNTGLARPFGLSDGRLSRISGFMRWRI